MPLALPAVCVCVCVILPGRSAAASSPVHTQLASSAGCVLLRRESNGGALRLTPPSGQVVDVFPHAGRLAMFLSKTVAHEVMPTHAPRHSFTLWYYGACLGALRAHMRMSKAGRIHMP